MLVFQPRCNTIFLLLEISLIFSNKNVSTSLHTSAPSYFSTKTLFDRLITLLSSYNCLWKLLCIFWNLNLFTKFYKSFSGGTISLILGGSSSFSSPRFYLRVVLTSFHKKTAFHLICLITWSILSINCNL